MPDKATDDGVRGGRRCVHPLRNNVLMTTNGNRNLMFFTINPLSTVRQRLDAFWFLRPHKFLDAIGFTVGDEDLGSLIDIERMGHQQLAGSGARFHKFRQPFPIARQFQ